MRGEGQVVLLTMFRP